MKKLFFIILSFCILHSPTAYADGLETFLQKPDPSFEFKPEISEAPPEQGMQIYRMTSLTWKDLPWNHRVILIKPSVLKHPDICLLYITGSKSANGEAAFLKDVAERTGAYTAVIGGVPNQPMFERKEDALLAYSFKKYIESGDESWPIIFPMVKSVQRAMDLIKETTQKESVPVTRFVLSGASKRGWTTWLTGASDKRVVGIAPIVFDMLNMREQIGLAAKAYGEQSEKIKNYTELGLIDSIDQPRNRKMREWVDPYSFISKLTMPKLILLGTNDPYWVVDAQRNYFDELPGTKILFQVANGDHHISSLPEVVDEIVQFYKMIAAKQAFPEVKWKILGDVCSDGVTLNLHSSVPAKSLKIWKSSSDDRDFRDASWNSAALKFPAGAELIDIKLQRRSLEYRAFVAEATVPLPNGEHIRYSSRAYVLPDIDCR